MTLSISNIVVTSEGDKVVAVDWTYTNADGQRGNRWKLHQPYGNTPLTDCTEEVLRTWLNEQWPENTIASLDRTIAEDKARREQEATLNDYTVSDSAPMRVEGPADPEVAPMATKKRAPHKKS